MGGGGMKPRPPFIPHVPFDLVLAEPAFPPVESPSTEQDEAMTNVSNPSSKPPYYTGLKGHRNFIPNPRVPTYMIFKTNRETDFDKT